MYVWMDGWMDGSMYVCMYGCIDVQRRRGPFASEADDFFTDILVV